MYRERSGCRRVEEEQSSEHPQRMPVAEDDSRGSYCDKQRIQRGARKLFGS